MRGRAGMKNSSSPTEGCLHVIIRGLVALFVRKICNITCPLSISLDGPLKPPPSLIGSPYQNNPSCVFCNGQYVFVTQNHISPSLYTFFCNYFIFTHKLQNSWICRRWCTTIGIPLLDWTCPSAWNYGTLFHLLVYIILLWVLGWCTRTSLWHYETLFLQLTCSYFKPNTHTPPFLSIFPYFIQSNNSPSLFINNCMILYYYRLVWNKEMPT